MFVVILLLLSAAKDESGTILRLASIMYNHVSSFQQITVVDKSEDSMAALITSRRLPRIKVGSRPN